MYHIYSKTSTIIVPNCARKKGDKESSARVEGHAQRELPITILVSLRSKRFRAV